MKEESSRPSQPRVFIVGLETKELGSQGSTVGKRGVVEMKQVGAGRVLVNSQM